MVYPLLKSALEVRDRFGTTPKPHLLAQVVSTFAADATLAAGDADLKGDPVADVEAQDLRPDSNDGTGGLMTKR